jgi:hypothetical protein
MDESGTVPGNIFFVPLRAPIADRIVTISDALFRSLLRLPSYRAEAFPNRGARIMFVIAARSQGNLRLEVRGNGNHLLSQTDHLAGRSDDCGVLLTGRLQGSLNGRLSATLCQQR